MKMNGKTFAEVMERFRFISVQESFDCVVAIANGGIIPAAIINQRLGLPLYLLTINWRDDNKKPRYDSPRLMMPIDFDYKNKKILLVDDRVKSGSTILFAKEKLAGALMIKTFAVNGHADYALYDENCFRFPWLI